MTNDSTTIKYQVVRDGVNKIDEIANKMSSIFSEFDSSMSKVLNPEVFAGVAADAVGSDYATLKSQFEDFIQLVKQFEEEYRKAANIMETHETTLEHKTETINQDLVRM
jgi:uncharacterized protein YukE